MPELPEVESIRRSLEARLIGRVVTSATLRRRDVLIAPGDPFGGFSRQRDPALRRARPRRVARADLLQGATIIALVRRGKQLAMVARPAGGGRKLALGVQLGMSGQLFARAPGQRVPDATHIHAAWRFDDGARLLFRDPRRFGSLRAFPDLELLNEHFARLGPDALTVDDSVLGAALARVDRSLKAALLDQSVIAGVGNIYADEALFAAGLLPSRRAGSVSAEQAAKLAAAIRSVLTSAIAAGGSTLRDYVDANGDPGSYQQSHSVYGRGGEPCVRCGRALRATTLAQRTTVYCGRCQG